MPLSAIVPLDGSSFAEQAIAPALRLCAAEGRVDLVTVVPGIIPTTPGVKPGELLDHANQYLAGVVDRIQAATEVNTHVLIGQTTEELCALVDRIGSDLMVMASHGHGPLARLWLGSTTDRLARVGEFALLVAHPREDREPSFTAVAPFRKILVPMDESGLSDWVLGSLARLVGTDVSITLLRVAQNPYSAALEMADVLILGMDLVEATLEAANRDVQAAAAKATAYGFRDVDPIVKTSEHIAQAIVRFGEESGFDLIALPRSAGRSLPHFLMGSVADKIVRSANTPVLLLPRSPDAPADS